MLYLLFVLTFLAGILFYGLSPHDKGLDMSTNQAEGMIVTFLAQHQAAKDYLYKWLGVDSTNDPPQNIKGNVRPDVFLKVDDDSDLFNFEAMMPKMVSSDMCANNNGTPGQDENACFVSRVFCVDSAGNACGCNGSEDKRYVVTYGGWVNCNGTETGADADCTYKRPDWWPPRGTRMRRFESWRKAIAKRTRGSISCGTLVNVGTNVSPQWCIDNGKSVYKNESAASPVCMTQVPSGIIDHLGYTGLDSSTEGLDDLLFCMSEFKQGLGNYVSGVSHFYDGLANEGPGKHRYSSGGQGSTEHWIDLASTATAPDNRLTWIRQQTGIVHNAHWLEDTPYLSLDGYLNTKISLGGRYTVTILAESTGPFDIFKVVNGDGTNDFPDSVNYGTIPEPENVILKKEHSIDPPFSNPPFQDTGQDVVYFNSCAPHGYLGWASICNMDNSGINSGIVSWTFVVNGTSMKIYENTVPRFDETIMTTLGKYLVLGDTTTPRIYGIRYYPRTLTAVEIQKNFKVDQKRFGIPDINNGKILGRCVNDPKGDIRTNGGYAGGG